jgi:hypothetical protein
VVPVIDAAHAANDMTETTLGDVWMDAGARRQRAGGAAQIVQPSDRKWNITTSTALRLARMSRQRAEKGDSSTSSWPLAGRVYQ